MANHNTSKKVTRVGSNNGSSDPTNQNNASFVASDESKGKAKKFRVIAIILWVLAIAVEVLAIFKLRDLPINMTALIIMIVVILIFAVIASYLWKKSNRLDPASEKEKVKFFIQSQLGLIMSVIVFLPLVILVFTNKNMDGKQKGIIGSIAVVALLIAGVTGTDFNPPSVEQYTEQTQQVESLMDGINLVYWTKSGKSYHLHADCSYINSKRTTEIFEGTVANARELKNITDLCDRCERRAVKENSLFTE